MAKHNVYTEIHKLHGYKIFKKYSLNILVESLSNFFSCSVKLIPSPKKELMEKYNIDIQENVKRGFYPIDGKNVLILGRVFKDTNLISVVGLHLSEIDVKKQTRILNIFENIFTGILSDEFPIYFENSSLLVGDELIKRIITKYIAKGRYDERQVRHLIEYFFKLRTTSFEGNYFSTGAIFTKSDDIFEGKRFGVVKELTNPFFISDTNKINKRVWYLVDGKTSFFVGNKNLCFNNIFLLDGEYSKSNFLDTHSLALTLKGGDFLIKIENEKLMSLVCADGSEFLFFENQWRYRNYAVLKQLLEENITTNERVIGSILFYVLTCSKKQLSTILWFPDRLDEIDPFINVSTKNSFLKEQINITDSQSINHIFRCLSSDGASIIDKNGNLLHMGVIINIEKSKITGLTGTGESAASILGQNGVSIKISSDGQIKIFVKNATTPYYF
jgi:hypothetical protein